ncbi:histidinol dehydrogenase [Rhodobacteraceae bacterium NNCM2]|nr:histidinol dehydrogenase [Coraliihabitans acroporae]
MITYLKQAPKTAASDSGETRKIVQQMLDAIEAGGEEKAREYAADLDKWTGDIVVSAEALAAAADKVPQKLKDDIRFAHDNVRRFAEAQLATMTDTEMEVIPGLIAGQKQIPVTSAGCYVPGGRYSHVASAIMTVTTAKVAGVSDITACSPTIPGQGIPPAILYTLDLCGADRVLNLGGVQGVAAMCFGLFGATPADILVGPGNQFVAEAKRILFGRVGIDMFAGPTDSMILADETADAEVIAVDLVSQAEHGYNSPVWLATTSRDQAEAVMARVPDLIADLPELNAKNAEAAWRDYAEVMVCDTREEVAACADRVAPEHLSVQAADLDWWLGRLRSYGSLFLGEETTVTYGDKCSGTNHVLPTSGAARYTGGLSVHKYMKTVTWQRATREANRALGPAAARISRLERMEGHARAADVRVAKYFPGENFDLSAEE